MKTFDLSSGYDSTFEPHASIALPTSKLVRLWNQFWKGVIDAIDRANEPHVWKDERNADFWYAYDPMTGSKFAGSEAEVRTWLEERYYTHTDLETTRDWLKLNVQR